MAIDSVLICFLRAFTSFNQRLFLRRLNKEEVNLIDHYRTLPERESPCGACARQFTKPQ